MTRIAVFADLHGNLPALKAILEKTESLNCTSIYSLGDSISIGPYSNECIDLIRDRNIHAIIGNHEEYFIKGIKKPLPSYMSEDEYKHQMFVHSQISSENKEFIKTWKDKIETVINGSRCLFIHSPFKTAEPYNDYIHIGNMNNKEIENTFIKYKADIIFFGHTHVFLDINAKSRYINPGSVGCHKSNMAFFTVIEFDHNETNILNYQLEYNKNELLEELEIREVPARDLIKKIFF